MSALAASLLVALATAQSNPPTAPANATLVDRIVAVVDEDPILWSDVEQTIALGLVQRQAGEDDETFDRRVLDRLIEIKLRFHEIDRFGLQELPLTQVESQFQEIRNRFPDEEAFQAKLADLGLTPAQVREILARRLAVSSFVEQRLGPRVFVSLDDIRQYYEETLVPEMRRRGQGIPEISAVREQIRTVLREQRLNDEIASWTDELRFKADVVVYLDEEQRELPPVVE